MKGKIPAFEIALSAVACALATAFLTVGVLYDVFLPTGYILACFALMLPLSKNFIAGDVLAYIATVVLTLLFGGLSVPWRIVPFVLFFGLHPLVNYLQLRFRWNKIILLVVKIFWFDVTLYIAWRFVFDMTATFDWVNTYIIPCIAVGGTLFFIFYDGLVFRCQKAVNYLIYRIKK